MENTEKLFIKNETGEIFMLHPNYDKYAILSIEGLNPPQNDISISAEGAFDGGHFNNSHLQSRNIVLSIVFFGENEFCRKQMYRIFPLKSQIELHYKNSLYDVNTFGYVESIDSIHYPFKEKARISIICPNSYLQSTQSAKYNFDSSEIANIINDGDIEAGFIATIKVETDEQPELTIITQTIHLEDMLKYQLDIFDSVNFNPESNTLNVYVDNTEVDASAYSAGYLIDSGGNTPYLKFNEALGLGSALKTIIYAAGGRAITDLQHVSDDIMTIQATTMTHRIDIHVPEWFEFDSNQYTLIRLDRRSGDVEAEISHSNIHKIEQHSSLPYFYIYLLGDGNEEKYFRFITPTPQEHYTEFVTTGSIYSDYISEQGYSNINYNFSQNLMPKTFSLEDDYTLEYKKNESDTEWLTLNPEWINQGYPTLENRTFTCKLTVPPGTLNVENTGSPLSQFRITTVNKDDYQYDTDEPSTLELLPDRLLSTLTINKWGPSAKDNFSLYTLTERKGEVVSDITDSVEFTTGSNNGTAWVQAEFPQGTLKAGDYVRIIAWHSDSYLGDGDLSEIPHEDFTIQTAELIVDYPRKVPVDMMTYYANRDRRCVYMNSEKIVAEFENIALGTPCWLLHSDEDITGDLTIEIVSSIAEADVRNYTDTEVDAAMKYVDGLELSNTTTGNFMKFNSFKFRSGDTIEISTLPGDLHAIAINSDWMEKGKSLLYDVIRAGSFFKLSKGLNEIKINADTNDDFLSCEISVNPLFGGV